MASGWMKNYPRLVCALFAAESFKRINIESFKRINIVSYAFSYGLQTSYETGCVGNFCVEILQILLSGCTILRNCRVSE